MALKSNSTLINGTFVLKWYHLYTFRSMSICVLYLKHGLNKQETKATSIHWEWYEAMWLCCVYFVFDSNFQEAVLDIYNCQSVTLDHLNLQNNSGNGRLLESNRGNTGGVAFGYEGIPSDYVNPVLTLSNSNFSDNRALGFLTPERAVTGNVYLGRGGGVGLFMNEAGHNLYIEITNCSFMSNQARLFGGGLFILTTSYVEIQHQVFVTGCHFEGNTAMSGGSGVQLSFLRSGNTSNPHRVVFSDSQFIRNRSPSGGGVYVFVCEFQLNYHGGSESFGDIYNFHILM